MIGAGRLHDLAWSIELDALSSDLTELGGAVDTLRVELDAVVTALQKAHPEAWHD
jgi:hypothetical protein